MRSSSGLNTIIQQTSGSIYIKSFLRADGAGISAIYVKNRIPSATFTLPSGSKVIDMVNNNIISTGTVLIYVAGFSVYSTGSTPILLSTSQSNNSSYWHVDFNNNKLYACPPSPTSSTWYGGYGAVTSASNNQYILYVPSIPVYNGSAWEGDYITVSGARASTTFYIAGLGNYQGISSHGYSSCFFGGFMANGDRYYSVSWS